MNEFKVCIYIQKYQLSESYFSHLTLSLHHQIPKLWSHRWLLGLERMLQKLETSHILKFPSFQKLLDHKWKKLVCFWVCILTEKLLWHRFWICSLLLYALTPLGIRYRNKCTRPFTSASVAEYTPEILSFAQNESPAPQSWRQSSQAIWCPGSLSQKILPRTAKKALLTVPGNLRDRIYGNFNKETKVEI